MAFGLVLLVTVVAAGGYYILDDGSGEQITGRLGNAVLNLAIVDLPTSNGGVTPSPDPSIKLPNSITVEVDPSILGGISAYRVAGAVLLGTTGWTGSGGIGANGNISIDLLPTSDSDGAQPQISVYVGSPGTGNVVAPAAPFNEWVRKHWQEVGTVPTEIPGITGRNGHIVKYTIPQTDGLEMLGAAYSDAGDTEGQASFTKIEVTLPTSQRTLASAIIDYAVRAMPRLPTLSN